MTRQKLIDEVALLETMDNRGEGERGVFSGDGYAVMMNCRQIHTGQWNKLDRPYRTSGYWLSLVEEGVSGFSYNLHKADLTPGYAVVMRPGVIVSQHADISQFDLRVINIESPLLDSFYMEQPYLIIKLDEQVRAIAERYFELIADLNRHGLDHRETIGHLALSLFHLVITHHAKTSERDEAAEKPKDRREEVFTTFMQLLNEHGLEHHRLSWYADRMATTTNYLNRQVKEASGLTMGQWIDRLLVMEAKAILVHSDLSIEQTADYLHFPNSPQFCRFFKRHTGITPSQYRKKK